MKKKSGKMLREYEVYKITKEICPKPAIGFTFFIKVGTIEKMCGSNDYAG